MNFFVQHQIMEAGYCDLIAVFIALELTSLTRAVAVHRARAGLFCDFGRLEYRSQYYSAFSHQEWL
jgi:hypothetical protein